MLWKAKKKSFPQFIYLPIFAYVERNNSWIFYVTVFTVLLLFIKIVKSMKNCKQVC